MKLTDKVIIVTGASSGIGLAAAKKFAQDKCNLVISARNQAKLKAIASELEQSGSEILVVPADITNDEDIRNIFAKTVQRFGRIDAIFNNAGLGFINPLVKLTEEEIRRMVDTNVTGMIITSKYAAEQMISQGFGHIVMTSSIAGLVATPQWSVYSATKWAITGFSDGLRQELVKYGVRVTSLHPGPIKTEFFDRAQIDRNSLGEYDKMTTPEQVADAVYNVLFTKKEKIIVPRVYGLLLVVSKFFPFIIKMASKKVAEQKYH